ncbi:transcription elongation factor GreA [Mycoplasma procyoni]|uniref:transcription elongation factor GreA n=1 Tax=Mycoplasma procyoni TaxID=568784 RepID=UPI00197B75A8|nr:transcription elongation factor GreA [Mycoplasma procyoni]MBN3534410.1 transcription elongation factor GreA [Mycoplasma procyoni]
MKNKNETNDILLTQDRLESLQKELAHLIEVERPKVIEDIKDARNQGDLSENAEYDAAREKQGQIESRIHELENIISRAKVISESNSSSVAIGSLVRIELTNTKTLEKQELEVKIVGSLDANPFENKISNISPLAQSILGQKVGDTTEMDSGDKYSGDKFTVRIISIN